MPGSTVIAAGVAALAAGLVAVGEWLHGRRVRRLGRLAFGPEAGPRPWVRWTPRLRVVAVALLAWGFATLLVLDPKSRRPDLLPEGGYRHILLALDVSPSMELKDAGPEGNQTRRQRARDVLFSLFERVALDQVRISVIAFYNGAKPVVIDTFDLEVVRNILDDLPLDQAFDLGKTKILDGLRLAAEIAKPWKPGSAVLVIASDGDTVPDEGMPEMPAAIAQTLVVGVGDARAGKFIDGHQSRQDASTLRQIAGRLRGVYHDGNARQLPSEQLARLARIAPLADTSAKGWREGALVAIGVGAGILSLLPLALARYGSRWQPVPPRKPGESRTGANPAGVVRSAANGSGPKPVSSVTPFVSP